MANSPDFNKGRSVAFTLQEHILPSFDGQDGIQEKVMHSFDGIEDKQDEEQVPFVEEDP
jgi:hypothetical protein